MQYKASVAYSRRVAESKPARALDRAYPDVRTALAFTNPFELLVATILSAQSTDATVNRVTPELRRPILVLTGEHDSLAPAAALTRELENVPQARLAVIPEADHFFAAGLAELSRIARDWFGATQEGASPA